MIIEPLLSDLSAQFYKTLAVGAVYSRAFIDAGFTEEKSVWELYGGG